MLKFAVNLEAVLIFLLLILKWYWFYREFWKPCWQKKPRLARLETSMTFNRKLRHDIVKYLSFTSIFDQEVVMIMITVNCSCFTQSRVHSRLGFTELVWNITCWFSSTFWRGQLRVCNKGIVSQIISEIHYSEIIKTALWENIYYKLAFKN